MGPLQIAAYSDLRRCLLGRGSWAFGYFRRNHWVPVPRALDLAQLNAQLLANCHGDESRILAGRSESVGAGELLLCSAETGFDSMEDWACSSTLPLMEKEHLLPLAGEDFELAEVSFPRVDQAGCAKVAWNREGRSLFPLKGFSFSEQRRFSTLEARFRVQKDTYRSRRWATQSISVLVVHQIYCFACEYFRLTFAFTGLNDRREVTPRFKGHPDLDFSQLCPHCSYGIEPNELVRRASHIIRFPNCRKSFDEMAGRPLSKS